MSGSHRNKAKSSAEIAAEVDAARDRVVANVEVLRKKVRPAILLNQVFSLFRR